MGVTLWRLSFVAPPLLDGTFIYLTFDQTPPPAIVCGVSTLSGGALSRRASWVGVRTFATAFVAGWGGVRLRKSASAPLPQGIQAVGLPEMLPSGGGACRPTSFPVLRTCNSFFLNEILRLLGVALWHTAA